MIAPFQIQLIDCAFLSDSTRNFICKTLYRMVGTEQVLMKECTSLPFVLPFSQPEEVKEQNYFLKKIPALDQKKQSLECISIMYLNQMLTRVFSFLKSNGAHPRGNTNHLTLPLGQWKIVACRCRLVDHMWVSVGDCV